MDENQTAINVAVIGAGAGGLVVGRHLTAPGNKFNVVIYEQTENIGGTWVYRENVGRDSNGIAYYTSMYKYLRTNLPKEIMAFLDFPFPEEGNSYLTHYEVLQYLKNYCQKYDIERLIKFRTSVLKVTPVHQDNKCIWEVIVQDLVTKHVESNLFDAVAVCNGHYSVPMYPEIPDTTSFGNLILHSHDYRIPEPFTNMVVVVLGAGPSGVDISLEVANYAKKVILSHKLPWNLRAPLPSNLKQMPWVTSCKDGTCVFENGESCSVDAVIICTGYKFSFPFLTPDCGIQIVERRIMPLYKHFLNIKYPTMAFFGIPSGILPFPFMDIQAQMFLRLLDGSWKIPSEVVMNEETDREMDEFLKSGGLKKHFLRMGPARFQRLVTEMTTLFQLKPLPPVIHKLFHMLYELRRENLMTYRDINYKIIDNDVIRR